MDATSDARPLADATPLEQVRAAALARLLTFADIDARTLPVRKVHLLTRALTRDLGGDLSTAQDALVRRAAVLIALCEHSEVCLLTGRQASVEDYLQAANTLKRLLCALNPGLRRMPKDIGPSLVDLIREDLEEQTARERAARQEEQP
jgi:hypothetical protein